MTYTPDAYVPPPPPPARRGLSPWAYLGIGCLALFVLVFGLIGFSVYRFVKTVNAPVNKTEVIASLGPVPVHPKAKFDETLTKVAQATGAGLRLVLGGKDVTGAAFRIPAAPRDALGWYDVQLSTLGYKIIHPRQNSINAEEGQLQHQYFKTGEAVVVQAQNAPEDRTGAGGAASLVMVMRIQGVTTAPRGADSGERG